MPSPKLSIFISHPSHFLTDHRPHGDGLLAYSYIDELAKRGHQLHVAVPLMDVNGPVRSNVHFYPVNCVVKPSSSSPSLPHRLEYAVRVRGLLNRIRRKVHIDLIHQLNPVVSGISLFLPAKRIPLVLGPIPPPWSTAGSQSTQGHVDQRKTTLLKKLIRKWEFAAAKVILIPTRASLSALPTTSSVLRKIAEVNYGVNTDLYRPQSSTQPFTRPPTILFMANLLRRKGIFILLDAFKRIAPQVPDCQLIIAGDGPDANTVRQRVQQSPYQSRIKLLGVIKREDVPLLMQHCSVYCLPSYGEPFGMSALEAMACGVPVVGTKTGGLGTLLAKASLPAVEPDNDAELSSTLLSILQSRQLQTELGRAGRLLAEREFSWHAVMNQLEAVYGRTLQRERMPAAACTLYQCRNYEN